MKPNIITRICMCVLLAGFALFALGACSQDEDSAGEANLAAETIERLERENAGLTAAVALLETTVAQLESITIEAQGANQGDGGHIDVVEIECDGDCVMLELPELWAEISGASRFSRALVLQEEGFDARGHIRVFERGNANIRLFPDGTFVANLWHSTKISGTYTEMTQGNETAVLFSYSGITNLSGGVSTFEETGLVTVVGGIVDDVLTMPEDWDDGHGHGMEFAFAPYPVVFVGSNGQRITLYADNTFVANLSGDVTIIGFYGMRATSITFAPGSPTFSSGGVPVGSFLFAQLVSCGDDYALDHNRPQDDAQEQEQPQGQGQEQEQNQGQGQGQGQGQEQEQEQDQEQNQEQEQEHSQDYDEDEDGDSPADVHDSQQDQDLEWCDDCEEWH